MSKRSILGVLVIITTFSFYACKPEIVSFTPKKGGEGTTVTINGKNFKSIPAQNTVRVGEVKASDIIAASENKIVFKVPSGVKSGKISVETSTGTGTSDGIFVTGEEKGYAVAIGLNAVDPNHYAGWSGELDGCEPDARNMASIAAGQGLSVETLFTASATREAVLSKLTALAERLKGGDLLVVSYSGHGGQIPDQNGDEEDDRLDETWCLYNGELLDDELYKAWSQFQEGVRILVFSDSCHSGTALKMIRSDYEPHQTQDRTQMLNKNLHEIISRKGQLISDSIRKTMSRDAAFRSSIRGVHPEVQAKPQTTEVTDEEIKAVLDHSTARVVPWETLRMTYEQNRSFYDALGRSVPGERDITVRASAILISGCQDNQTSMDMGTNGLFTLMLKQVWDNGAFSGNHLDFHLGIRDKVLKVDSYQSPNFYMVGSQNDAFVQERPYTIFIE